MGRLRAMAIGAVLIVLAASVVQIVRANRACEGDFTYAADDAYTHLALARQIAMKPAADSGASQAATALSESASPGWTLLLAGVIRLSGGLGEDPASPGRVERLAPLIINLIMAALLVMLVGHMLRFDVRSSVTLLGQLVAVALLMPMPTMVLTGMEHLAHAFILLMAVAATIELIERDPLAARRLLTASFWVALAVMVRFESLAVVMGLVLWAWTRRRLGRTILPAMAGFGLAVGWAITLAGRGQSWLPVPVQDRLLDGAPDWAMWSILALDRAIGNLRAALVPAAMVLVAAAMLWSRREQQSSPDAEDRIRVAWMFVFVVAGVSHLLLGRTDETFRYTAYLVPFGAVAILRALANRPGAKWSPSAPVGLRYAVMAVFCLLPIAVAAVPAARAAWQAPEASREVFACNRKMAAFVRTFMPQATVAAGETGALRYETRARVLDLKHLERERNAAVSLGEADVVFNAGVPAPTLMSGLPVVGGWKSDRPRDHWSVTVLASPGSQADVVKALKAFSDRLRPGDSTVWFAKSAEGPAQAGSTQPAVAQ